MSDDDNEKDPDYVQVYSTIELEDIRGDGNNASESFQLDNATNTKAIDTDVENTDIEYDGHDKYKKRNPYYKPRPKRDRRTSLIWTKFTIIDEEKQIAACNICHQRLSHKSTSGNLKKHLERKHGYSIKLGVMPFKRKQSYPKYLSPTPKPKVSELAGISDEGITVKVVGENGEEEHFQVMGEQIMSEEVVQEVQEHDYSTGTAERGSEALRIGRVRSLHETRSSHSRREPEVYHGSYSHLDDKAKRKRIMKLQMECLENKKYNMQLEALLMEQQLNLPRSIFTQPLRYADVSSRGTQTEVGGSDTRVFYVTDKRGGRPIQQLFAVEDLDD